MIQTRYKGTRRSILQVSIYYDLSKKKKKRIEKKHITCIYKAYIFLPINNDMFSNNIKCKFMSYLLVFMIIYLYIE